MYENLPIHIQPSSFKGEVLTDRKKERFQTADSIKKIVVSKLKIATGLHF